MNSLKEDNQPDYPTNNNEYIDNEDNNYDSAPPLIPTQTNPESSDPVVTIPEGTAQPYYPEAINEQYNQNYDNNPQENIQNNRNRRKKEYKKASKCRKVFQIIFSIILYILILVSISFQIFDYGINLALVDDIFIGALGTFMLVYSIKGYSTANCKFGCFTLLIAFIGFGVRGGGSFLVKKNFGKYLTIFMIRTFILFFMTSFNCNQGEVVIHI